MNNALLSGLVQCLDSCMHSIARLFELTFFDKSLSFFIGCTGFSTVHLIDFAFSL